MRHLLDSSELSPMPVPPVEWQETKQNKTNTISAELSFVTEVLENKTQCLGLCLTFLDEKNYKESHFFLSKAQGKKTLWVLIQHFLCDFFWNVKHKEKDPHHIDTRLKKNEDHKSISRQVLQEG